MSNENEKNETIRTNGEEAVHIEGQHLDVVNGGVTRAVTEQATCDLRCSKCGFSTPHQIGGGGEYVCIFCGTPAKKS